MKKTILTLAVALLAVFTSWAQGPADTVFTLVAEWNTTAQLTDSTFSVSANHPADQLGQGFLPTQIQVGYRGFDAFGRLFEITAVGSADFGSSTLTVKELQDNNTGPGGVGLVYRPLDSGLIPVPPGGNTGLAPATLARLHIHNVANGGAGGTTTEVLEDSILVFKLYGSEVGRDTIRVNLANYYTQSETDAAIAASSVTNNTSTNYIPYWDGDSWENSVMSNIASPFGVTLQRGVSGDFEGLLINNSMHENNILNSVSAVFQLNEYEAAEINVSKLGNFVSSATANGRLGFSVANAGVMGEALYITSDRASYFTNKVSIDRGVSNGEFRALDLNNNTGSNNFIDTVSFAMQGAGQDGVVFRMVEVEDFLPEENEDAKLELFVAQDGVLYNAMTWDRNINVSVGSGYNFGLGTTSPSYVLDIQGADAALRLNPNDVAHVDNAGLLYYDLSQGHFVGGTGAGLEEIPYSSDLTAAVSGTENYLAVYGASGLTETGLYKDGDVFYYGGEDPRLWINLGNSGGTFGAILFGKGGANVNEIGGITSGSSSINVRATGNISLLPDYDDTNEQVGVVMSNGSFSGSSSSRGFGWLYNGDYGGGTLKLNATTNRTDLWVDGTKFIYDGRLHLSPGNQLGQNTIPADLTYKLYVSGDVRIDDREGTSILLAGFSADSTITDMTFKEAADSLSFHLPFWTADSLAATYGQSFYVSDQDSTLSIDGYSVAVRAAISASPGQEFTLTLPAASSDLAGRTVTIVETDANTSDFYYYNIVPAAGNFYRSDGGSLGTTTMTNETKVFRCLPVDGSSWAWHLLEPEEKFAEMYIPASDPDTISITSGTPAEGTDWSVEGLAGFTYSAGRLTYSGPTQKFLVNTSISCDYSVANASIQSWVYLNGSAVDKTLANLLLTTAGDIENFGQTAILTLSSGDYLELFFDADTNGTLILNSANLNVIKI